MQSVRRAVMGNHCYQASSKRLQDYAVPPSCVAMCHTLKQYPKCCEQYRLSAEKHGTPRVATVRCRSTLGGNSALLYVYQLVEEVF